MKNLLAELGTQRYSILLQDFDWRKQMDLKEKFGVYKTRCKKVENLQAELEKAIQERSEAIKAIAVEIAPKKKILCEGKELTIVVRGETYFFRGENKSKDAVEI